VGSHATSLVEANHVGDPLKELALLLLPSRGRIAGYQLPQVGRRATGRVHSSAGRVDGSSGVGSIHMLAQASGQGFQGPKTTITSEVAPSSTWELDFYSRPVQGADGKKMWELLVTDDVSSFRHVEVVPANCVNSRELRTRVQRVIDEANVKPTTIRFFRSQMRNMISIALRDLQGVAATPCRITYSLYNWIDERERDVYPKMPGYRRPRKESPPLRFAEKLPDNLRGERYAVASLPLAEFLPGGSITEENIGFGRLCPLPTGVEDLPADQMITGINVFSGNSELITFGLGGMDLADVTENLELKEFYIETGIDTAYLLAKLRSDGQVQEARLFEESKRRNRGLHFLSVQRDENSDPEGFYLLRDPSAK
jgi:hypothetical protein